MRPLGILIVTLAAAVLLSDWTFAQPEEGRRRGDRQGRRQRGAGAEGRGPREGRPPVPPIIAALDTDEDGEISKEEIENAVAALKTLDENEDGKLSGREIHPPHRHGDRRAGDGPEGARGRGPAGRGPEGSRGRGPAAFIDRLMENDKNGDDKLSKDEVPERLKARFDRVDENSDEFIDRAELEEMSKRFRERGQRGRRGEGGDRPRRRQPEADDSGDADPDA